MQTVLAVVEFIDAGPEFVGWAGQVEGEPTCAMSPRVLTDPHMKARTALAMPLMGAWCSTCTNIACPLRTRTD